MRSPRRFVAAGTSIATVFAASIVGVVVAATPAAAAQYQVVQTISVGSNPFAIALNRQATKAFITHYTGSEISVLDTATNTEDSPITGAADAYSVGSLTRLPGQFRLVDHAAVLGAVCRFSKSCRQGVPRAV